MTQHHPDSLILMEYSAGNLSEPHALCVRLHLEQCPYCRSRVDMLNSLGAVMMESRPKVSVDDNLFDRLLTRIEEEPSQQDPLEVAFRGQPDPLRKLLGEDLANLPWKRQLGDVSVLDITDHFPGQPERVVLQKLTPGGKAPAHTHRGTETTVILQGAYTDNKGLFKQWDFIVMGQDDTHKPIATHDEDCITLSVLSAPLKLTGGLTRLLNPLIR